VRRAARSSAVVLVGLLSSTGLKAQAGVRGYALDVAQANAKRGPVRSGFADFARFRLMAKPQFGPLKLDLAYEQTLVLRSRPESGASFLTGQAGASGDWLNLGGRLASGSHSEWRHRVDRLSLTLADDRFQLRAGRQTVSWATTLFLTPADPFSPFDPADPYREYRAGVDALRLEYFAGPFTELDFVVRPAVTPVGRTLTALGRVRTTFTPWDVAFWGGALHDEPAAALSVSGSVGPWALRAETVIRRDNDRGIVRGAAGVDRRVTIAGGDLYFVIEYQHDGFGAARAGGIADLARSDAFRRGELQLTARDAIAAQATMQVHPLVGTELLLLRDIGDRSLLLTPAVNVSLSDEMTLRLGLFQGFGDAALDDEGVPRTEFGALPRYGYLSLSFFF
jgi:hypothetical protein